MNETEFLRQLEGEEQAGSDLLAGAEHFVRLKIQSGLQRDPEEGLELEKEATTLRRDLTAVVDKAGEHFTAFGKGVKDNLKFQGFGIKGALNTHKSATKPLAKTHAKGALTGAALPALAAGGAGYAVGHSKEKKAEDKAKLMAALAQKLKGVDPGLAAVTGLGAAGVGIGTYLGSRPQKDTGKSKIEEQFDGAVASQQAKPERGLVQKMRNRGTEFGQGIAQAYRDHPVKAGLLGAATGAAGGYQLGKLMGAKGPAILQALKARLGTK